MKKKRLILDSPEEPEFVSMFVELIRTSEGLKIELVISATRKNKLHDSVRVSGRVTLQPNSGTVFKAEHGLKRGTEWEIPDTTISTKLFQVEYLAPWVAAALRPVPAIKTRLRLAKAAFRR